ncbi:beta-glucosidase [Monoraphidium neglectum]|uniref:beta-glucosidase n=1 Tax=Monoraphidium neglectum TaxID=145388 RepID=A0A0D2LSH8_9CHLO|nr:beta-glucosidase [Monoraphidium neglectum]KIY94599.1 beta-glucosidase [Monoraphidium neglectum]|eukprot:XP_013893619.1 beta-glucosidase [Monoraphidium neglectum]
MDKVQAAPDEHRKEVVDPYIESTGYWQDASVDLSDDAAWKTTAMGWGVHPEGIRRVLNYIQAEYNPRGGIIVTENGVAVEEAGVAEALKDIERAVYLKRYLTEVHKAVVKDDVNVRGYFVNSLLDSFEWGHGFTKKFGLHYVNFETLERVPKMSANWLGEVIRRNRLE